MENAERRDNAIQSHTGAKEEGRRMNEEWASKAA
jgi:hypothetical protein